MKWLEVFKIYSLKQIKKEKILFLFTTLSILIATSISIIIPLVNLENQNYIERNIKEINGGDLTIGINGEEEENFEKKLKEFKNRGLNISFSMLQSCYYTKLTNNIMGTIVIGDYDLEEDEIILQGTLANSLGVDLGDTVELDTKGNGKFKYKVKAIEGISKAVDRDAELLGYGKVKESTKLKTIEGRKLIYINGDNGEDLKNELLGINKNNFYNTVEDKRRSIKDELLIQKTSLGILSTVTYIFSALCIISTTIMLIFKRKKDIAILRLLSIEKRDIKRALGVEVSLWLLGPIILSSAISYLGAKVILGISGIIIDKFSSESILLIIKGVFFNGIMFLILMLIALIMVNSISAMSLIREDEKILKKEKRKIIALTITLLPILLVFYSLYSKSIENLGSALIVMVLITIFLGIISLSLKLLSLKKFRSSLMIYSIKSIKNRFFSFIFVLLSLTLTLWFVLMGFDLESSIKDSFRSSFEETLPYDYFIQSKDNKNTEEVIKNNKDIKGSIKTYDIEGRVTNKDFNNIFRTINISEVKKGDYNSAYKIIQGQNLFEGEKGFIISDKMREMNSLDLGENLETETKKGIITGKIKGVYKSGGINTLDILKEDVEFGEEVSYFVKSSSGSFIDDLRNSSVASVGDMGDRLAANISGFMKIFRILSILCLLGTILFNINMTYMNSISDEKDEEILMALGLGKGFVMKAQVIKLIILVFFSSILSLGIYYMGINLFSLMFINSGGGISIGTILVNILLSIVIATISFNVPLRKIKKKRDLNLLRE